MREWDGSSAQHPYLEAVMQQIVHMTLSLYYVVRAPIKIIIIFKFVLTGSHTTRSYQLGSDSL